MKDEEIKETLDILKKCKDYDDEVYLIKQHGATLLLDYITNLQERVNQYENPDDLTLFYMWLDEKAKDKLKKMQEENKILKENAEHNDKVVDKARWNEMIYKSRCEKGIEYIKDWQSFPHTNGSTHNELRNLLNILQGENNE